MGNGCRMGNMEDKQIGHDRLRLGIDANGSGNKIKATIINWFKSVLRQVADAFKVQPRVSFSFA